MSKLIDNIFDYETIRYVPIFYQNEWKSLYNSYKTNYFKEQNKIFNIYCTKKYDNKLNEYNKLKYMKKLNIKLLNYFYNLQPKYNSDIDYSDRVKRKLLYSINKISKFVDSKLKILTLKNIRKKKKNKKIIETFNNNTKLNYKNLINFIFIIIISYIIIN